MIYFKAIKLHILKCRFLNVNKMLWIFYKIQLNVNQNTILIVFQKISNFGFILNKSKLI